MQIQHLLLFLYFWGHSADIESHSGWYGAAPHITAHRRAVVVRPVALPFDFGSRLRTFANSFVPSFNRRQSGAVVCV
uniref:Secreted protein n=1 Tax=Ascaris lumbricoides TaxID=6252 RepID=A0A0M3HU91_ASCLU